MDSECYMLLSDDEIKVIEKYIEIFLTELEKAGNSAFQKYPTVKIYFLKHDLIGITLINKRKDKIECEIVKKPKEGDYYFFISKSFLDDISVEWLAERKAKDFLEELQQDNAYSINIKRVESLIKDDHFAVALVFLVSAFENAIKDIFFRHNELWFFTLQSGGVRIDIPELKDLKVSNTISITSAEDQAKYKVYKKWEKIGYWEEIYRICKKLRVLDDYLLRLMGNKFEEIGFFQILKYTLKKSYGEYSTINFQRIYGRGGVKWCLNKFYSIDLAGMNKELQIFKEVIQKRHQIIHGSVKDDEIKKEYTEKAFTSLQKLISFIKDEMRTWYLVVP